MRLDRPTPLPAASFLQLMWLASPALPVGGFSYSEGLESAIENAGLASEAAVGEWLLDQLHITQARGDMALIAKAVGAWRRGDMGHVKELNDWVLHTRETSELRLQTEQMGRSMADWLRNQYQGDEALMPAVRHLAALPPPTQWPLRWPRRPPRPACARCCWHTPLAGPRTWCRPHSNPCNWAKAQASASWPGWPPPSRWPQTTPPT